MSDDNQPKTTAALAREMRESLGMPDTDPPTEFNDQPAQVPADEGVDPEFTDFAQSVDSTARGIEADDATADAIEKARGTK